jgi:hypothetical protein
MDTLDKFTWIRAVISKSGPPSPTTRLVLLVLGVYMKTDGSDCRPSIQTLCEATALSRRTIIDHINKATTEGWIEKVSAGAGLTGKKWKRSLYLPKIPTDTAHLFHLDQQINGASPAPRNNKVVQLTRKGGASNGKNQSGHLLYEKEKNIEACACEIFDLFVSEIQPARKSKQRAIKNIITYLNRGVSPDTLKTAIMNYKSTLNNTVPKYRKDPANFFSINDSYAVDFYPEYFDEKKGFSLVPEPKKADPKWKPFDFTWNERP